MAGVGWRGRGLWALHPGKPQGSQGDNRGQVGSQPSPDACPVEGASVPIRRSGCWEDSEAHVLGEESQLWLWG